MSQPRPPAPPSLSPVGSGAATRTYVVGAAIGRGSFGSVYRARLATAAGFQKEVAVKILDRGADDQLLRRLRDEARILGLLKHRAIVGVDDLVEIDGRWAVVMEFVEGVDLARLAAWAPVPLTACCEIAREVALALDAAHRAVHPDTGQPLRVVHRDIKTSNVRITPKGEVKVLDFGIATARFDQREARTQKAVKFGTPGYMAPERFLGAAEPASDVFALGALLYRLITNRKMPPLPPVPSGFEQGRRAALAQLPGPAAPLAPLIERMLAFEAEDRPSANEVAGELRRMAVGFDGPWLEEWATERVPAMLAQESRPSASEPSDAEASGSVEVPTPPARTRSPARPRARWWLTLLVVLLLIFGLLLIVAEVLLIAALLLTSA